MCYLKLPFFPVLLGIYPVIFLYAHNQQHFMINVVLLPMMVSLLFVLLGFVVFYAVMKSAQKAALMVGICCGTVILYNPIYLWIQYTQIETPFFSIGPTKLILASTLLIILLSFIALIRTKSPKELPCAPAGRPASRVCLLHNSISGRDRNSPG